MFWTDSLFPNPASITNLDPSLPGFLGPATPNTTLLQLCSEAYSHCAGILASHLQSVIGATNFNPSGGATALHNASVIWGVRAQSNVVRLRMGQVVMNDLYSGSGGNSLAGPLSTWLTYWAVTLGYRKLVGRALQNTDVALNRYKMYKAITSNEKWPMLSSTGLPYVRVPLPAPGALYEPNAGVWSVNNLSNVTHPGTSGGLFRIAITWVCQTSPVFYISPATKNNSESGPSMTYPDTFPDGIVQTTITSGNALRVGITGLNPPTGIVPLPEASITGVSQGTMIATGWNLYVGASTGPMYMQNAVPIPLTTTSYTLPGDPVLNGYILDNGQYPDANMPLGDLMMRS